MWYRNKIFVLSCLKRGHKPCPKKRSSRTVKIHFMLVENKHLVQFALRMIITFKVLNLKVSIFQIMCTSLLVFITDMFSVPSYQSWLALTNVKTVELSKTVYVIGFPDL